MRSVDMPCFVKVESAVRVKVEVKTNEAEEEASEQETKGNALWEESFWTKEGRSAWSPPLVILVRLEYGGYDHLDSHKPK